MRLAVIAFTRNGGVVCGRLMEGFRGRGEECQGYIMGRFSESGAAGNGLVPVREPLKGWTGRMFAERGGIVFVGAVGIAVRAIAPFLRDKGTDPAVVAVDEGGRFAVALLSGHMGGANRLARTAADLLGAVPVITTATDGRGLFSVDEYAVMNGYFVDGYALDREVLDGNEAAKRVSSDLLDGRPVGFFCGFPVEGGLPEGFVWGRACGSNVYVTACSGRPETAGPWPSTVFSRDAAILRLVPPVLCVGMGCKRGVGEGRLKEALWEVLSRAGLLPGAIGGIASVDLKADEEGLLALARGLRVGWRAYTADELSQTPGEFEDSNFVSSVAGVGNVCERAACRLARERMEELGMTDSGMAGGYPRILVHKQRLPGITVAVAAIPWTVRGLR